MAFSKRSLLTKKRSLHELLRLRVNTHTHPTVSQRIFLKISGPLYYKHSLLAHATPVHDFSSVVAGQLAESIVAVNNRPLHDLCISQQETGFWDITHTIKAKSVTNNNTPAVQK